MPSTPGSQMEVFISVLGCPDGNQFPKRNSLVLDLPTTTHLMTIHKIIILYLTGRSQTLLNIFFLIFDHLFVPHLANFLEFLELY